MGNCFKCLVLVIFLMPASLLAVDQLGLYEIDGNLHNDLGLDDLDNCALGSEPYRVIDGVLDLDCDGIAGELLDDSNSDFRNFKIINGLVDVNDSNGITEDDRGWQIWDGTYSVFAGYIDTNQDNVSPSTTDPGTDAEDFVSPSKPSGVFQYFLGIDDTSDEITDTTDPGGAPDRINQDTSVFAGDSDDGDQISNFDGNGDWTLPAWQHAAFNMPTKSDIQNAWAGTFGYQGADRIGTIDVVGGLANADNDVDLVISGDDDGEIIIRNGSGDLISIASVIDGFIDLDDDGVTGEADDTGSFLDANGVQVDVANGAVTNVSTINSLVHATSDFLLYFGADVVPSTGNAVIGFWFLQDENITATGLQAQTQNNYQFSGFHTEGDLLIQTSIQSGSGVNNSESSIYVWDEFENLGGSNAASLPNADLIFVGTGCVDSAEPQAVCTVAATEREFQPENWHYEDLYDETDPSADPTDQAHQPGNLIEGGLNVSAVYRQLDIPVPCYSKAMAVTRSSAQSATASLDDYLLVGFESCGITIRKTGDNVAVVGDTVIFTIEIENTGLLPLNLTNITDDLIDNQAGAGTTALAAAAAGCSQLAGGETCTFQVSYETNQGDTDPLLNTVSTTFESLDGKDTFSASADHSVDLIYVGSIGDQVWLDEDGNGVFDAGEDGIAGMTVILTPPAGVDLGAGPGVAITTTTDANGQYIFTGLPGAVYTVSIDAPTGLNATYDFDGSLDNTTTVTLAESETNTTTDFGLNWVPPNLTDTPLPGSTGAIGDRVWNDADGDGVQDEGESGIANVGVVLSYDSNGDGVIDAVYSSTVTDATGHYIFDELPPGIYEVTLVGDVSDPSTLPVMGAALPTASGPGGFTQTFDPDESGICSACDDATTSPIVLAPGDFYQNADFGYQDTAGGTSVQDVSGTVYLDADVDGSNDTSGGPDTGIAGVTVSLAQEVLVVDGYLDLDRSGSGTTDNGILDGVEVINGLLDLNGDGSITEADDGYFHGYTVIDGYVDITGDGTDSGALDTGGTDDDGSLNIIVATTTTDANGYYNFPGVEQGYYSVIVTDSNGGLNEMYQTGDPDEPIVCTVCDNTTSFQVAAANVMDLDFGYAPTGHEAGEGLISGTVGLDAIANDMVDAGEELAGIDVTIYQLFDLLSDGGGNFLIDLDNDGDVSGSPSTDDNGLLDGFRIIEGYVDFNDDGVIDGSDTGSIFGCGCVLDGLDLVNGALTTDPTLSIELATETTNVNGYYAFGGLDPQGQYSVELDPATYPAGTTNDFDYGGGTPDGISTVINLYDAGDVNNIQTDVDFGLIGDQSNTISGTIWNDTDADGTLDEAFSGLDAITVELRDADGNVIATTTTDSSGNYTFNNVPNGTFYVWVTDDDNHLNGYWLSDGVDNTDNESQVQGYQVTFSGSGGDTADADFGFYVEPASIGNTIFNDTNGDGIQDTGEPGIENVLVTLTITYLGPDGSIGGGDDTVVTLVTSTDASGNYSFDKLLLDEDYNGTGAGDPVYNLSVDTSSGSPVNGYLSTDGRSAATDDSSETLGNGVDGDADDPDGTAAYAVQGETDNTNDFGFVLPSSISGIAWSDDNGDGINVAESPLEGITVNLLDASGAQVFDDNGVAITALTAPDGTYTFSDLYPGSYTVAFGTAGSYLRTLQDQGGDDTIDSDASPTNGWVTGIVLTPGTNLTDVDAGYIPVGSLSGYVLNDDGDTTGSIDQTGGAGDDTGISRVIIELWADDGSNGGTAGDGIPDSLVEATTTGLDGSYSFSDIRIGDYVIVETQPAGFVTVLDADTSDDGDTVATPSPPSTDDQIAVTVQHNVDDADNVFLEIINSTVAVADDNNTIMDYPVSGDVLFNDWDPQNKDADGTNDQTISVQSYRIDTNGDGVLDAGTLGTPITLGTAITVSGIDESGALVANAGMLTLNEDGTYTFTPADGFTGEVNAEYTICDDGTPQSCDTTTLRISVNPWPDPVDPAQNSTDANDDENISYGEPVSNSVSINDGDAEGDTFSVTGLLADTDGDGFVDDVISVGGIHTVYGTDENENIVVAGTITIAANGDYTYTPCTDTDTPVAACDGEFKGTVLVVYTNTDNNGAPASDTATLTIQVLAETDELISGLASPPEVNDPPVAGDDLSLVYYEGPGAAEQTVTGNWLSNDYDPNGDSLSLNHATETSIATDQGGTIIFYADGSYTYSPPTDYLGPDQLTYEICDDGTPSQCDVATIYLLVLPLLDFGDLPGTLPPTASPVAWEVLGASAGRHYIRPGLRLGLLVDAESDGFETELTNGDNNNGFNDEDSTTLPAVGPDSNANGVFEPGSGETGSYTVSILVTNDTGEDAVLVAYIDWNCDGIMQEPGAQPSGDAVERARIIVDGDGILTAGECGYYPSAGTRYCALTWGEVDGSTFLMSSDAEARCGTADSQKRTYARLRLTTEPAFFSDASPSPNGRARDGEVEDFNIIVSASTTPAIIVDVQAIQHVDGGAVVSWTTASELGTVAFRVERLTGESGKPGSHWDRVHEAAWIPSRLELQGSHYQVFDADAVTGDTYLYRIIEKTSKGRQLNYGPYELEVTAGTAQLDIEPGYSVQERYDYDRVVENLETRAAAQGLARGKSSAGKDKSPDTPRIQVKNGGISGAGKDNSPDTLRIQVERDGIHGLSVQELVDAFESDAGQVESMLRRGQFRLSSRGQDIPWYEQDGMLYFYGQGTDNLFSLSRTYWLYMKQDGVVMSVSYVTEAAQSTDVFFDDSRDHEQDAFWWLSLTTDPESDYWIWDFVAALDGRRTKSFKLPVPGAQAVEGGLTLRLWGASNAPHLLSVKTAGGVDIGPVSFNGNGEHSTTLTIPAAAFDGDMLNLEITAESIPGGAFSAVLIDGFEVSWQRAYTADAGALKYPADGATSISGFATDQVVTMDVLDPLAPIWITGGDVSPAAADFAYSAYLPPSEYASAEAGQILKPLSMELDDKSNLRDKNNRADYVIITHAELMDAALALSDYRSIDFRTMVVDIQDIYDEFSAGEPWPTAINDFVKASQAWKATPSYMVILGDGSFDYRDIMGTGYNFVSPQMYGTSNGLFASDTLLGDITSDGVPEVAFGRIPIKSVAEGLAYLTKLSNYESGIGELPSLLLTDNPDEGGDFTFSTLQVEQAIGGTTININLQNTDITTARAELYIELDSGVRMVNYLGHGGVGRLASQGLIVNGDAAGMDNHVTPSFVGLSCLINNYAIPGWDGLGERLVIQPDGGMVVSWAASGESYNDQATALGVQFHGRQDSYERLGDAIIGAFQARPYLVPVYTLIGDPALRLQ